MHYSAFAKLVKWKTLSTMENEIMSIFFFFRNKRIFINIPRMNRKPEKSSFFSLCVCFESVHRENIFTWTRRQKWLSKKKNMNLKKVHCSIQDIVASCFWNKKNFYFVSGFRIHFKHHTHTNLILIYFMCTNYVSMCLMEVKFSICNELRWLLSKTMLHVCTPEHAFK